MVRGTQGVAGVRAQAADATVQPTPAHERVYLSPPSLSEREIALVTAALRSGWAAPVGPDLTAFEQAICAFVGVSHGVALSSGTAAIHLGLKALGVEPGDEVVVPTLTFAATAFAVHHAGATPVFLDCEETTWNLDPTLLDEFLAERAARNALPAAIVTVDLFGRMCDYAAIEEVAAYFDVPILEDAAEALGATQGDRAAGSFGRVGVFSFNGNKIVTTSGGGMLVSDEQEIVEKAQYWSTQSREDFPWYEHHEVGFNYRMSNILAALGRGQLERLPELIEQRRRINAQYQVLLADVPGVEVVGDDPWGRSTHWLTTIRFRRPDGAELAVLSREALELQNIESRPVWKPMHQQPVFAQAESRLTGAADRIFADGLCLPSGARMADDDLALAASIVTASVGRV
jgi:dTDP-4-amino-4,6-dideoxygalactose transaminase